MKKTALLLVCLVFGTVPAQAISGIDIGLKGGFADNFDQPDLSISSYDIGRLNLAGAQIFFSKLPMVDLIISADYTWRNETYEFLGQGFEFKLRDLTVTASIVYPFKVPFADLYAGVGGGTHSFSYEYVRPVILVLADNDIYVPEGETYMGYHALVGAKIKPPAFPFGFFIEGRWATISTPGENTSFNTWAGGLFISLP